MRQKVKLKPVIEVPRGFNLSLFAREQGYDSREYEMLKKIKSGVITGHRSRRSKELIGALARGIREYQEKIVT